jgi:hypothetical protein
LILGGLRESEKRGWMIRDCRGGRWWVRDVVVVMEICFMKWVGKISMQ